MNNFDFLVGTWDSVQRRLASPLTGSGEWDEFTGRTRCYSLLDGAANLDEVTFPEKGFGGVTLRLLNRETDEWSIYWANSRTGILALPPVVGRFVDGVGEFFSMEDYAGRPIVVRYRWSDITPTSARWAQAFSVDGRETWETNWEAEFTRTGPTA
jgi:hypothetical protein